MNIIFETLAGSKLYGTDSETSDTDIKGVFLPTLEELVLNKAVKTITMSTGNKNERNTQTDIDKTYYSLQYFLQLVSQGETNCIDMLFAFTNKNAILKTSDIWNSIIENRHKIISKNIRSFMGYCKSQCIKYSYKGDKLKNFNEFLKMCKDNFSSSISLLNVLEKAFNRKLDEYIPKVGQERIKINFDSSFKYNFGEHCYFITAQNKESYISISDIKFILSDNIKSTYSKCEKVISSYGNRAKQASDMNGIDYKAISHCVRVLDESEELLLTGNITFPLKNVDFIKSIKYGNLAMSYDELMQYIENRIKYIEENVMPKSILSEKSSQKLIDLLILNAYNLIY